MLREIDVSVRTRLPTATAARKIELSDMPTQSFFWAASHAALDLAENLVFTKNCRVDAGADPEEVLDGLIVVERVQVIVQDLGSNERTLGQEVSDILERTVETFGQNVDLGSVTGAENDAFGDVGAKRQVVQRLVERIRRDGDLLENIKRRRGVIETDDYKRHVSTLKAMTGTTALLASALLARALLTRALLTAALPTTSAFWTLGISTTAF